MRDKKRLRLDDRFTDLVKTNKRRIAYVYDQRTPCNVPMDFEAVGKPNMMVSLAGRDCDNTLVMNQLSHM